MAAGEIAESARLRREAAWVVGWRTVGIVVTFLTNILAARLLGPAEYGGYLVVITVMAFGSLLGMAGQNEAGLRFLAESLAREQPGMARAYLRQIGYTVGAASLLAAGVVAAGMLLVQRLGTRFTHPTLLVTFTLLGLILLAWQQAAAELIRAHGDLRLASVFSGGQTGGPLCNLFFLLGLVAAGLVAHSVNVTGVVVLTVLPMALTLPLSLVGLRWRSRMAMGGTAHTADRLTPAQVRELHSVGGTLLLNQVLAFFSQQLDIWLGAIFLAPHALGLYGAAKRSLLLAAMPVQMATMTVVAAVPRLYCQNRKTELQQVVRSAATHAAIPSGIALLLLALFPQTILNLVFGGSYTDAAPTVLVLVVGNLLLVLLGNPPYVLTMTGYHRVVVMVNLLAATVMVGIGASCARHFGPAGLAAGSAAGLAVQNGCLWWLTRRHVGVWTHVTTSLRSSAV